MLESLPFFRPTPASLVRQLADLPPAPKVLHKLQRVTASPDSSLQQIAELVSMEPGLSARVVRMANSALFGRGGHVGNIVEAIQRVGLSRVREVVTYALSSQIIGKPLRAYRLDADAVWSRAVACGLAASSLAGNNGLDEAEAYTAGLMHGLGLVVLDLHVARRHSGLVFASSGYPLDFAPAERALVGFSHAETGAALLAQWGFSEGVVAAVEHQLQPEAAPEAHRRLCVTLATARWARSLLCVPEEKIPNLPPEAWLQGAGIALADFNEWLTEVRHGYNMAKIDLRLA